MGRFSFIDENGSEQTIRESGLKAYSFDGLTWVVSDAARGGPFAIVFAAIDWCLYTALFGNASTQDN